MFVQSGLADQACIFIVKRRIIQRGVCVDKKLEKKQQLRVRLSFEIHVETISISTEKLFLHGTALR